MDPNKQSLGTLAVHGIFWSIVQNWGGRIFTVVLFILLARFLSPADYGTAAAAGLVLMLIQMLAEFGFGDAIVQRQKLQPADVNLPFYASLTTSFLLLVLVIALSGPIEGLFQVEGLSPVMIAICAVLPINTVAIFQEIHYRRNLAFKSLALRTFTANFVAGVIAITCAASGLGVWSIVVQTYIAAIISLVWLWRRPFWKPSGQILPETFFQLARFGISAVGLRLVDFISTRLVDFLIVGRYGLAVYGLYAVGARLYQTLLQLLQTALYDVSLSVLSRISSDRERMAELYLRSVALSTYVATPVFVMTAALAPEICSVLFGTRWQGVEDVARPMLLLGALQCVQFLNGPYLSARGRPDRILIAGIAKALATVLGLFLIPSNNVVELTLIFVCGQLAATPVTFGFTLIELNLRLSQLIRVSFPGLLANGLAFAATQFTRPYVATLDLGVLVSGLLLGVVFGVVFVGVAFVLGFKQCRELFIFFKKKFLNR